RLRRCCKALHSKAAILLDDAAMVRLFISEAPEPLDPRQCLSSEFVAEILYFDYLSAVEALLEPAVAGINASEPCNFEELPCWAADPNHRGWEQRVSNVIRRLVDTKSIGSTGAPSFMYAACASGNVGLVRELFFRFPEADYSYAHAIASAGYKGHAAVVREILHEAQSRGRIVADSESQGSDISDLLFDAAANGLDDVIAALVAGIDNRCIQADVHLELWKLADFGGHVYSASLLLHQATKLSVQEQLRAADDALARAANFDVLVGCILVDKSTDVAAIIEAGELSVDVTTLGPAAVYAGAWNVLRWVRERWDFSESTQELAAALFAQKPDIVAWLVQNGANPARLSARAVDYAFRNCHLDAIEALLAYTGPKLDLTEPSDPIFRGVLLPAASIDGAREAIPPIQAGQLAILQHLFSNDGLRGAAQTILRTKEMVRKESLSMGLITDWIDEAICSYLEKSRSEWLGSKADFFTKELLIFAILVDDARLFAEYLSLLDCKGAGVSVPLLTVSVAPSDDLRVTDDDSVTDEERAEDQALDTANLGFEYALLELTGTAVECDASGIVEILLNRALDPRVDALNRAVASESAGVISLLLSASEQPLTVDREALKALLGKELSESTVITLEVLAAHTSWRPLWRCLHQIRPPVPPQQTRGPVSAAEIQLRRRALRAMHSFRLLGFLDVDFYPEMFMEALCALGWEPPIALLFEAAPPETLQGRAVISGCIENAAAAGEAAVVAHLLAALAAAVAASNGRQPWRLLDAVELALNTAVLWDRVAVAEQVLEGPLEERPPGRDLARVIRACQLRNVSAPRTSPAVSRYLIQAFARISSA
ncbi:hypothetical protein HK405_007648, partial [Cladochytrium tenue]